MTDCSVDMTSAVHTDHAMSNSRPCLSLSLVLSVSGLSMMATVLAVQLSHFPDNHVRPKLKRTRVDLLLPARKGDALHQGDVWQQERGSASLSGPVCSPEELVPRSHPGVQCSEILSKETNEICLTRACSHTRPGTGWTGSGRTEWCWRPWQIASTTSTTPGDLTSL